MTYRNIDLKNYNLLKKSLFTYVMIVNSKIKSIILSVDGKKSLKDIERKTLLSYSFIHRSVNTLTAYGIVTKTHIGRDKFVIMTRKGKKYLRLIKELEQCEKII